MEIQAKVGCLIILFSLNCIIEHWSIGHLPSSRLCQSQCFFHSFLACAFLFHVHPSSSTTKSSHHLGGQLIGLLCHVGTICWLLQSICYWRIRLRVQPILFSYICFQQKCLALQFAVWCLRSLKNILCI